MEMNLSSYDGIITIEDPTLAEPFRVKVNPEKQLILQFNDVADGLPDDDDHDDYGFVTIIPNLSHINSAIEFANNCNGDGDGQRSSLLIHCHFGISRSPAIALAVLMSRKMNEEQAVREILEIAPFCSPNQLMVRLIDERFDCSGKLVRAVEDVLLADRYQHIYGGSV